MIRTRRAAAIFVPVFLLLIAVQGLARGQTAPAKLYVAPSAVAPGGEIVLSGHGFTPGYLPNFTAFSDTDEYDLGPASADANGQFHIAVTLPAGMVPNTYTVFTFEGDQQITATLTVLPPPALSFVPALGKPGSVVTYTVTGLVPGSLRLDYAGAPVAGPLAVSGSVYTGTFVVPGDRPMPLGSTAAVTATNTTAGRVVGRAYAAFQSQAPSSPPVYSFNNVVITSPGAKAGDAFTVTGQIIPPPAGPISLYRLKPLWKTGTGQTFPINAKSTTIQPNGSFQIAGLLPSLFNGDAGSTAPGAQLNLTLSGPGNVLLVGSLFGMPLGPPPAVRLRVVNPQGQPIAGAWVSTAGIGALGLDEDESPASEPGVATGQLQLNGPNQFATFIDPIQPPGQNPFACAPTAAYGPTDGNGYFEPGLNWDAVLGILGQKLPIGLGPEGETIYNQVPATGTLTFNVNAWWQGYGTLNSNGQPQLYTRSIVYRKGTNKFHDPATGAMLNVNPLTVTLPALPPNTQLNVPIVYTVDGAVPKSGYFAPGYGTFVSFADFAGNPAVTFTNIYPLKVSFKHNPLEFGSLVSVTLSLDGQNKGTFQTIGDPYCAGATNYYFNLTNVHQLSAGWHIAHIRAYAAGGSVTHRVFGLYFAKPPDWFYNASYKNRKVTLWTAGSVEMSGEQLPTGSPGSSSTLGADVPRVGYLDNAAGADSRIWQRIKATGDIQALHYGGMHSKALNTNAPVQDTDKSVAGDNPITFSSGGPITILDTGWVPLFRDQWGIWPIASATIGADMAFNATLTYNGTLTLKPPASTLFVDPEATVAVDAWFDLSALFGVVSANAHAIPAITVGMPVAFVNGVKDDSDVCFRYRLDIKWSAKVGVCPLCDKESGTKNIFNDYTPKSALCAPGAQNAARAASTPPSNASPSLATDGFGHSLSVWSDDAGIIQYSTYNGVAWQAAQTLVADGASLKPRVAYFEPNQAVAVWTHNNLTPLQAQTANITDTVKAQHLRYAVWNGSSWTSPQNLTLPATGEGSVALAGCLSTTPGCPSGGAVTAAWVRDVAGALSQRQFRLYYATYQSGAWSAVQAVDAASTATDGEPALVYENGAPLAVWVRDADRNPGTLTDRRLAYRLLDGLSAVVVPADLPAGIAEPSAAIDASGILKLAFTLGEDAGAFTGNQRTLHTAVRVCSPGCAWSVQKLRDSHGRAIRAESPILTLDVAGQGVVTFRGLGFGPLSNGTYQAFPGDAVGMVALTGESAQVQVDFATTVHSPTYLTNDGAVNWHPAAVFDPALDQVHVVVVKGAPPTIPYQLRARHSTAAVPLRGAIVSAPAGASLVFAGVPLQPDFVVAALTASARYPQPGDAITATVRLRNDGATWIGSSRDPLAVQATWDGGPGAGVPAGSTQIESLLAGQTVTATISLTPPLNLDAGHTLFVTVNPLQSIVEASASNNSLTTVVGGIPAPNDVMALAQTGSSLIYLYWTPLTDRRIAGYRIYRAMDGGAPVPVGSTFAGGFVDVTAPLDHEYRYTVASYTADGVESEPGKVMVVTASSYRVYLPLIRR